MSDGDIPGSTYDSKISSDPMAAQSTMCMIDRGTGGNEGIIEGVELLGELLEECDTHTQDIQKSWGDFVLSQGPRNRLLQIPERFFDQHVAAQEKVTGEKYTRIMLEATMVDTIKDMCRHVHQLKSLEALAKYVRSARSSSKRDILDSRNPHAKQSY